ncbi:unnamed protein product [Cuscuta epithymum]|uniref:RNase H type-1 domain-containing protein n=1 Tax=Cuscuta epithymum TaxID=186058 RepID=A0AAV0D8B7_9ASTE|nr:unnamed protein product [Cuscuta epithymum]
MFASEMAMERGYVEFQVETDVELSISVLRNNLVRYEGVRTFRQKAQEAGLKFGHVYREGNKAAHYLAAQSPLPAQIMFFDQVSQLPIQARRSFYADLFGFPHFRF